MAFCSYDNDRETSGLSAFFSVVSFWNIYVQNLAHLFALAVSRCSEVCLPFSTLRRLMVWCLHRALFQTGLRPMLIPAEPVQ